MFRCLYRIWLRVELRNLTESINEEELRHREHPHRIEAWTREQMRLQRRIAELEVPRRRIGSALLAGATDRNRHNLQPRRTA